MSPKSGLIMSPSVSICAAEFVPRLEMSEMMVQGHEGWWDTYGSRTLPQFKLLGSTGRYNNNRRSKENNNNTTKNNRYFYDRWEPKPNILFTTLLLWAAYDEKKIIWISVPFLPAAGGEDLFTNKQNTSK